MCGREIYGRPINIKIEGAELDVCPACAKHGQKVVKTKPKVSTTRTRAPVQQSRTTSRPSPAKIQSRDEGKELVPDYNERIRLARQKMKLTQKDVSIQTKISVQELQSIETGKMRPSDVLIEKLEKFFKISITEEVKAYGVKDQKKGPAYQTLGDIVVIRKDKDEE